MNNDINTLIDTLIRLGEDKDELEFWRSIYPNLTVEEQKNIVNNLRGELNKLTSNSH